MWLEFKGINFLSAHAYHFAVMNNSLSAALWALVNSFNKPSCFLSGKIYREPQRLLTLPQKIQSFILCVP